MQRVHSAFQRRQLALCVCSDQLHIRRRVVHLANPARHRGEARALGGEAASVVAVETFDDFAARFVNPMQGVQQLA